jgi:hypothetical protein
MNKIAALIFTLVTSLSPGFSQSYYYDVIAGEGYGVRFWGGSDNWKIHMGNSAEYHFGPVSDYSLKTNMDPTGGRGWTWGSWGSIPVAGLSNAGHMQIAGTFKLQSTNEFEWGVGISKESNAGKIAYQKWSDGLDIVGAGTTGPNRKIRFWAEGGSQFSGHIIMDTGDHARVYTGTGDNELNRYLLLLNSPTSATASGLKAGGVLVADAYNYGSPAKNDLIVKGNVGIGTPSPVARLHSKITGSANTTYSSYTSSDVALVLQNGNSTANNFNILTFSDASGYGVADVGTVTNHTNHTAKLFFSTRPASSVPVQRMLIDENGNVGIGTPTPAFKLSVATSSTNTNRNALTDPDVGISIHNTSATNNNFSSLLFFDANGYISSGIISQTKSHASHTGTISLATRNNGGALTTQLYVDETGKVGIGSLNPSELLTVNGKIYGKQVKVDLSVPGPDYVFEESYSLPTLDEVKSYIDENKHLPEVPSAKEMEAKGIDVGEMNMLLLKKVEELTLYVIQQQKQIDELKRNKK